MHSDAPSYRGHRFPAAPPARGARWSDPYERLIAKIGAEGVSHGMVNQRAPSDAVTQPIAAPPSRHRAHVVEAEGLSGFIDSEVNRGPR